MTLTTGINHVATITDDLDRLVRFYVEIFDAEVVWVRDEGWMRHAFVDLGAGAVLHPFEIEGNRHSKGVPTLFDRGHLDHVALNVIDDTTFGELRRRLVDAGASDGTITDYGSLRSIYFTDPDGAMSEITQWRDGEFVDRANARLEPYEPNR
jgi:catechol 2,3-dioxygenase-like lactoylglutathione lyase family enzyme